MPTDDQKSKGLGFAVDQLKLEVGLFWQRSLFFWGFAAAALVAYGVSIDKDNKDLPVAISCFGLICTITLTLANRASKYWQDHWLKKVQAMEKEVLGTDLFSKLDDRIENTPWASWWRSRHYSTTALKILLRDFLHWWWGPWRYSATALTIALSDIAVAAWAVLLYFAATRAWSNASLAIIGFTALYAIAIAIGTSSKR